MQEKRKPFDDLAKSLLEEYKVTPHSNNWEGIQDTLSNSNTDALFKQLKDLSVAPPSHNWEKIQRRLPLHVIYRQQIQFIGRVAAILVLAFCLPQLVSYHTKSPVQVNKEIVKQLSTPTFGEVVEKAVQEKNKVAHSTYTPPLPEVLSPSNEAELLLASLLADDQEFPDTILDIDRLHSILQPIEPLPVISAVARIETLPVNRLRVRSNQSEPVELNISVPLIFIEEGEAEQLIELYDRGH